MSWPLVSLGEMAKSVDYGLTASASDHPIGPKFLRITDIQDDAVDWDSVPYCVAEPEQITRNRLADGDIVFARTGATTGKSFLVRNPPNEAVFASYLIRVRPNEWLNPVFLSYFFRSPNYWSQIEKAARGAAQPGVNASVLKELAIPLPTLAEQRRIAAILDKADSIRHKREQAITFGDDLLRSQFLEMFGDPFTNPKGHPIENFETILLIPLRNGISPSSKGKVSAYVLTLSAITGDRFDASQVKEGKFLDPISPKDAISRSDFYICRGNGSPDLIGKGYFADQDIEGTAFPDTMIAARPDPRKVTRAYLEILWNSPFVRSQIREAARTTNGTFKINQTAAGGIRIPVPPMEDQQRYQVIADKVAGAKAQLACGSDLFLSLSQRAFRGEL